MFASPYCLATVLVFHTTLFGVNEDPPNASPGTGFATVVSTTSRT